MQEISRLATLARDDRISDLQVDKLHNLETTSAEEILFHICSIGGGAVIAALGLICLAAEGIGGSWVAIGIALIVLGALLSTSTKAQYYASITLWVVTGVCAIMVIVSLGTADAPNPLETAQGFGRLYNAHPFLPISRGASGLWAWLGTSLWWSAATIAFLILADGEMPFKEEREKVGIGVKAKA